MNKTERKAALAVLGAAVTVTAATVRLLKRHTRYMAQKAAAHFKDDEWEETLQDYAADDDSADE